MLLLQTPNDVQREIFAHILPFGHHERFKDAIRQTTTLLGVCKAWRDLGLSMPSLWSTLNIEIGFLNETRLNELVRLWLHRSRNTPLSIHLAVRSSCTDPDTSSNGSGTESGVRDDAEDEDGGDGVQTMAFGAVLDFLIGSVVRWRYAHFSFPPDSTNLSTRTVPIVAPLLERLTIDYGVEQREFPRALDGLTDPHLERLLVAPRLRFFKCSLANVNLTATLLNFPNLTEAVLNDSTPFTLLKILDLCPTLQKLSSLRVGPDDVNQIYEHLVTHDLRFLTLSSLIGDGSMVIINHLTLPSLESLDLENQGNEDSSFSLASFISRSCCPLRKLAYEDNTISVTPVVEIIGTTSTTLVQLILWGIMDLAPSDRLYYALAVNILCPNLARLSVSTGQPPPPGLVTLLVAFRKRICPAFIFSRSSKCVRAWLK